MHVTAFAPGRVNLIGDHTDTTGGWCLPMAIDLGTTVTGERGGDRIELRSASEAEPVVLELPIDDPTAVDPAWGRYVAGVAAEVPCGFVGTVETTLPVGAGLSSSASLALALALAFGFDGGSTDLALAMQRAEQRASGVPCGVMDQLASAAGVAGHALLLDTTTLAVTPVPLPDGVDVVVVHSGEPRTLAGSAYADRRAQTEAAQAIVGPLRDAPPLAALDGVLLRRARHVVSENGRVQAFAAALTAGDLASAGALMVASHRSLADDYEVSTPGLDALVDRLCATDGVFGARLTGAGFGGCAVALCERGALSEGWVVRPSAGASRT